MRDEMYEEARRELASLYWLDKAIDARAKELTRLRGRLYSIQSAGEKERVSGTKSGGFSDGVAKLVDELRTLDAEVDEYIDRRQHVVRRIQGLHDMDDNRAASWRTVLYSAYVLGMTDIEVGEKMNYSDRHIRRIRQEGIAAYADHYFGENMS